MKDQEKRPVGRPSKYKEEYCEQMIKLFSIDLDEVVGDKKVGTYIPMFMDFALEIGVNVDTLKEWRDTHPNFSAAYKTCKTLQERHLVKNMIANKNNPYAAQFMLKNNHGWKDKQEVEQKTEERRIVEVKRAE